jgi:hypothetical protein
VPLFTSHTLGCIIRKLKVKRECSLRRRGVKMVFVLNNQPTLEGKRVCWIVTGPDGIRHLGESGTVWEAAEQIEKLERR